MARRKEKILKHITTKNRAIAVAIALGFSVVPGAQAADKGCSDASLTGTFAYTTTGSILAPPALAGPFASVGTQTFDGIGGTTATATVSQNGNIVSVTIKGTYTVNPNCTGTMTLQISPVALTTHLFFVIDQNNGEFQALQTDSGIVVTGIARRQFPTGDWRQ
jgi:hypothetical protein